jgi:hypothetical protein
MGRSDLVNDPEPTVAPILREGGKTNVSTTAVSPQHPQITQAHPDIGRPNATCPAQADSQPPLAPKAGPDVLTDNSARDCTLRKPSLFDQPIGWLYIPIYATAPLGPVCVLAFYFLERPWVASRLAEKSILSAFGRFRP